MARGTAMVSNYREHAPKSEGPANTAVLLEGLMRGSMICCRRVQAEAFKEDNLLPYLILYISPIPI